MRADPTALDPRHMAHLRASAIAPAVIDARGYRTVHDPAELRALGFAGVQAIAPALLVPVHGVGGEVVLQQCRPDTPRKDRKGKPIKYETPSGSRMKLDVHPFALQHIGDPTARLWITEGVKKGDALVSAGECAIALLGVESWRGTNAHGGKTVLADWEYVALNGRQVIVVFDSDVMAKEAVARALERLGRFLKSKGAETWFCYLPGEQKVGVDDFLAAGGTIDGLMQLTTQAIRQPARPPGALPVIQVNNRHLRDITGDTLEAIHRINELLPRIFHRGSEWVRLRDGGDGVWLEPLTAQTLPSIPERYADFLVVGERDVRPARVPADVIRDLLSLPHPELPRVSGVSGVPTFGPDGRLICAEGFDRETGLYLALDGLRGFRAGVPAAEAVALVVDDLLGDFPFADDASRAHAVGTMVLPFVRPMIAGPTPLHLIDAPARGTGKGLLADVITIVATGRDAPVMSLTNDSDELEKRITAFLLAGHSIVLLDNVISLRAAPLAAALTAVTWQGRRLGKTEMVRVPNGALWLATGNNVTLSDELARRTVLIRLDAQVERPEERTGWRHPNLLAWTREHRADLVSAAISLVQNWISAGQPKGAGTLGRFESWVETVGGILEVAGIPGFLGNRGLMWEAADAEGQEWRALTTRWWKTHEGLPVGARDVAAMLREGLLLSHLWAGRSELAGFQRIGHALKDHRDRIHGGFRIVAAGTDSRTGNALYRLEPVPIKTPKTPETPTTGTNSAGVLPGVLSVNTRVSQQNTGAGTRTNPGVSGVSGVFSGTDREAVCALAAERAWPVVTYRAGHRVGGEEGWRKFTGMAQPDHLSEAAAALVALSGWEV